ncbi:hypothetical protein [Spiroplasma clarkii]|uniref:hypothetical protein n=1 Tax=Spiroplasma clarkii TaxID=2139 RepID=UPI0016499131|nr:hypothetical protein [Spiroplasma clarkii]
MLSIIFCCLGWMFFFGEFILGTGSEAGNKAFTLVLTFTILTYVTAVGWYAILLFWAHYIWIQIEENQIVTISSTIKKEKIVKVIKDENKGKVYINFTESKTSLKKLSFRIGSTMTQFIIENLSASGIKVEVGNQEEFYQNKVVELKSVPAEKLRTAASKKDDSKAKPKSESAKTESEPKTKTEPETKTSEDTEK